MSLLAFAAAHRADRVHQGIEVDALEVFADQGQTGVLAQIVGQLFDDEIGHVCFTCRVNSTWWLRL